MFKKTLVLFILSSLFINCNKKEQKKLNLNEPIFKIVDDSITPLSGIDYRVSFDKNKNDFFTKLPSVHGKDFIENENSTAIFDSSKKEFSKLTGDIKINKSFSISIWIKPDENEDKMHPIITRSANSDFSKPYYQFFLGLRGKAYSESPYSFFCWIGINNELIQLSSLISWQPNNWYNLVVTYNQKKVDFFINGKLQAQRSAIGIMNPSNEEILIAKHSKFDYFYNGVIDDLKIFNRCLSYDEISLMNY